MNSFFGEENTRNSGRDDESNRDHVEKSIVPALLALSKRGVPIIYDSGVEKQTLGSGVTPFAGISKPDNSGVIILSQSTGRTVRSVRTTTGGMIGGRFTYVVRASNGTDHQAISGELFFAIVNKGGSIFSSTGVTLSPPHYEIVASSTGHVSTLWKIVPSGNLAKIIVYPTGTLVETIFTLEYRDFQS